jgi:hypothetical protein
LFIFCFVLSFPQQLASSLCSSSLNNVSKMPLCFLLLSPVPLKKRKKIEFYMRSIAIIMHTELLYALPLLWTQQELFNILHDCVAFSYVQCGWFYFLAIIYIQHVCQVLERPHWRAGQFACMSAFFPKTFS